MCFNCLSRHHQLKDCPSDSTCKICRKKHHTSLHNCLRNSTNEPSTLNCRTSRSGQPGSVLQTAVADLILTGVHKSEVRILIDGGSEDSFIAKRIVNRLQLKPTSSANFAVETFGAGPSKIQRQEQFLVNLKSRSTKTTFPTKLWAVNKICHPLTNSVDPNCLPINMQHLFLADPEPGTKDVDILLGSDCFAALFDEKPPIRHGRLQAWSTIFGWVLAGKELPTSNQIDQTRQHCFPNTTQQKSYGISKQLVSLQPT